MGVSAVRASPAGSSPATSRQVMPDSVTATTRAVTGTASHRPARPARPARWPLAVAPTPAAGAFPPAAGAFTPAAGAFALAAGWFALAAGWFALAAGWFAPVAAAFAPALAPPRRGTDRHSSSPTASTVPSPRRTLAVIPARAAAARRSPTSSRAAATVLTGASANVVACRTGTARSCRTAPAVSPPCRRPPCCPAVRAHPARGGCVWATGGLGHWSVARWCVGRCAWGPGWGGVSGPPGAGGWWGAVVAGVGPALVPQKPGPVWTIPRSRMGLSTAHRVVHRHCSAGCFRRWGRIDWPWGRPREGGGCAGSRRWPHPAPAVGCRLGGRSAHGWPAGLHAGAALG